MLSGPDRQQRGGRAFSKLSKNRIRGSKLCEGEWPVQL
jgi:hypothetical protein